MELIGQIQRRKIYYTDLQKDPNWYLKLPQKDWVVFSISHAVDEERIPLMVKHCLDKNVSSSCSVGELAHRAKLFFDEEISWRAIDFEEKHKHAFDYDTAPVTTAHDEMDEGFWFATNLAASNSVYEIEKVVCINISKENYRAALVELISKINGGWLPPN